MGLNAFNIELLKRFRFSEPIFNPERFEGNIFQKFSVEKIADFCLMVVRFGVESIKINSLNCQMVGF